MGKITVIKTLALPILVQCFTLLPYPPDHIIKSLQNIFYAFNIWNGKTDKIKRSTLICEIIKWWFKNAPYSVLYSCFKGILDQENFRPHEPGPLEGANIRPFRCIWRRKTPSRLKQLANKFNSFWRDVILHYASIRDNPSTAPEEILSQPLWLNSEIKIGGKPVLYQHWAKADVFFINDLLKNEGGFLSLEQF